MMYQSKCGVPNRLFVLLLLQIEAVNNHYDAEVARMKAFREQCSQQIDLALVDQAIKQDKKNEVWRSIQQTLDRETATEVVKQYKEIVSRIERALGDIQSDENEVLNLQFNALPGR